MVDQPKNEAQVPSKKRTVSEPEQRIIEETITRHKRTLEDLAKR